MLEYMRKNSNSTIVWLIIFAIAVVFIFFGIGSGGGGVKLITVNGEEVSMAEYEHARRMISDSRRMNEGQDFQATEREINLDAARYVVTRLLVRQFGRHTGLTPSDQAVGRHIASLPQFQTDGRFDRSIYDVSLQARRMTPAAFEAEQRDELLNRRVVSLVTDLSRVQRPEVLQMYHFQEDKVALDYVFFPSAPHAVSLEPTEENLAAYYAYNQERWRRPARLKISYVLIKPSDFLGQVQVSDQELLDYYQENSGRFVRPESAEVSHILLRFPTLAPGEEVKAQTLARARAVYDRLGTEDFADVAREVSEDPGSALLGGALGALERGMTLANFDAAVFSLPLNQVSEPVETEVGYHLIRVTSRTEAGVQPFEEVKETLAAEQKAFRAREMAVSRLEDLIVRSETSPLADAASSMELEALTSDEFTAAEAPEFFENNQAAIQRAFAAPLERTAPPVELDEHLFLYAPLARVDSLIPPLDEVRSEAAEAWTRDEAERRARLAALDFARQAAARGWAASTAALESDGPVRLGRGDLTTRSGLLSGRPFGQMNPVELFASVHSLAREGDVSPLAVRGELDGAAGAFALALAGQEPADEALFTGQLEENFVDMLSMNKASLMYQVWHLTLHEASQGRILVPAEYLN